ncbi:MAG TPA: hypothetical protein VLB79_12545 [Solirubrobacterales bacterium]|nr:hypothetical protein [Solirubrobacterales bacterium]
MNLRVSADQAGWSIREAAWGFEERVLWRGSDAARDALDRADRATEPLQRLIQTRLTWPLADAYRARGRKTRAGLAASTVALAVAAGTAGAIVAPDQVSSPHEVAAARLAPIAVTPRASDALVLQGVTPQFQPGHAAPVPPAPAAKPTEKPAQVAWDFSQAFVTYEVGGSDKETEAAFASTATKQLAKALKADPPRLPASGKVPRARVLNVVLGTASKTQLTASVSLVRLRAVSELRLTLTRTNREWRVAQVLG